MKRKVTPRHATYVRARERERMVPRIFIACVRACVRARLRRRDVTPSLSLGHRFNIKMVEPRCATSRTDPTIPTVHDISACRSSFKADICIYLCIYVCIYLSIYLFPILHDLRSLMLPAGWDPYDLHDLSTTSVRFLGRICAIDKTDPAQPLTPAAEELHDL